MHRTPNRARGRGPAAPAPPGSGWAEGPHGPTPRSRTPPPGGFGVESPALCILPGRSSRSPPGNRALGGAHLRSGAGALVARGAGGCRTWNAGAWWYPSQTELRWACRAALGTGKAGSGSRSPSTAPPYCPAPAGAARVGSSRAGRAELGRGGAGGQRGAFTWHWLSAGAAGTLCSPCAERGVGEHSVTLA